MRDEYVQDECLTSYFKFLKWINIHKIMCHNLWCQKSCHDNLCCLFIMISCCHGNLAHTSNHVMVTFVFVSIHSILTICEITWSKCSWQYFCLCLCLKLDNQLCHKNFCAYCVLFDIHVHHTICVFMLSSHLARQFEFVLSSWNRQIVFVLFNVYLARKSCLYSLWCDLNWIQICVGRTKTFYFHMWSMNNAIWMDFSMELSLIIVIHGIVIQKLCCEI